MTDNSLNADSSDEFEYIPGVCNIGVREIRRRQLVGGIGLFLTITTVFGFYHQHSSQIARLGTFLPALVMSIGYLQARKKFCLGFGISGLFNFGSLGNAKRVISEADRKIDREAAIKLFFQAALIAAAITAFVFLLPSSK
jgi:hypothetical protein